MLHALLSSPTASCEVPASPELSTIDGSLLEAAFQEISADGELHEDRLLPAVGYSPSCAFFALG